MYVHTKKKYHEFRVVPDVSIYYFPACACGWKYYQAYTGINNAMTKYLDHLLTVASNILIKE